jgi:dTDP-4-amino-4,6-dideoxygalactose transaminase
MTLPAALGGPPAFSERLRFARPLTPPLDEIVARLRPSYDAGMLTNGPLLRELEERLATRLGVDHVIGVSSCTTGLMLTLQAIAPRERVVLPSFTFSATAHAAAWNGLTPVFAECDPWTLQLDPADAESRLVSSDAGAILATHIFGAPAPVQALTEVAKRRRVPLVFDAAHGLGTMYDGRPVGGFGVAEVFSMSPTKLVVAGEGGIVTTNDASLAEAVRMGRNYGDSGDYDTQFPGLNARLSEFHAATALVSLERLDEQVAVRRSLAARYSAGLCDIPGVRTPAVAAGDVANFKDFTVLFDEAFGLHRDAVAAALDLEGIETRRYFSPPVHRHHAYSRLAATDLPVTDSAANSVLSLPMFGDLSDDDVDRVVEALRAIHENAPAVATAVVEQLGAGAPMASRSSARD